MKYDAFLSYSAPDVRQAHSLRRTLEGYRIPNGLSAGRIIGDSPALSPSRFFFFCPDDEPGASSEAYSPELHESAFLIVLCSRRCARDPRVDAEIRAFKRLGRPHHILTVILDGEPNAAEEKMGFTANDECFPEALKYDFGPDGQWSHSQKFEPIAADARPHKDDPDAVVLKIAAGLLGVGFDDLYHREQRRQHRRLRVIIAASLALAVLLGALALQALVAERQSRIQLANTREINGYIESLFTNVDHPALQKMDPKLMSLILEASERDLDRTTPRPAPDLEAPMRQILGQAYLACGLWDRAIANLQRSLVLWAPTGTGNPSCTVSRRDLAEALIGAGKVAEAGNLLRQAPDSDMPVVRYQLARALALTGDAAHARRLLLQEVEVRPAALAQALQDPAFAAIHSSLPAPKQGREADPSK
jgi:tetratricopeptide (TPR) repeat protein